MLTTESKGEEKPQTSQVGSESKPVPKIQTQMNYGEVMNFMATLYPYRPSALVG